ncbi:Crp/Fnr family transcriptional regulator [Bacillus cihuensis]|uniref:Crp/Fnr family transcriptional regulator n=1 Tax=Bacillus cihuensis TaxID=1208599 RepID=UPI000408425E|nr:Crp/Fnr family transcriptional regulator [Bacillus cihuensis]
MQRLNNYMENNEQLYLMLKQCPYEILRQMKVQEFERNRIIYRQGEIQNSFSILAEGLADIYVIGDNGKTYVQSTYSVGDMIGEIEIFNQTPFMSNVKSITDVSLITVKREHFLTWLQLDQNFNQQFIRKIVGAAHRIIKKDEDSKLYSLHHRVCKYLLQRLQPSSTDGVVIHIDKQQLSQQLAVTQRSINRILLDLKDKEIIEMKNSGMVIRNIANLRHEELKGKS